MWLYRPSPISATRRHDPLAGSKTWASDGEFDPPVTRILPSERTTPAMPPPWGEDGLSVGVQRSARAS